MTSPGPRAPHPQGRTAWITFAEGVPASPCRYILVPADLFLQVSSALSPVPRATSREYRGRGFSIRTWSGTSTLGALPALSAQRRSESPAWDWCPGHPAHWAESGSSSLRNGKGKKDLPKPTERCLHMLEIHVCNSVLGVSPYKLSSMLLVHLIKDIAWPHKPVFPINTHWQECLKRADSAQCS